MSGCNGKLEAARGLVEEFGDYIRSASVIGVGTGSTATAALREAYKRGLLDGKLIVVSSTASAIAVSELGLRPVMPHVVDEVDFYFDGADEVELNNLYMIKGRGAALLGEKILASMARMRVYVVDDSKVVKVLGSRRPVPLEVVPWAMRYVLSALSRMGLKGEPRACDCRDGPAISDWGGVIIDVETGPIEDPPRLEAGLRSIPGVVETGIFIGLADAVVIGSGSCGYRVVARGDEQGGGEEES